jgi:hypothetical protein
MHSNLPSVARSSVAMRDGSLLVLLCFASVAVAQTAPVVTAISAPRQLVTLGQNLTLSVTAGSSSGLTYQWRRSGRPISGATASSYTLGAATARDHGWYQVVLSNTSGTTVSPVVFVNVVISPADVVEWDADRPYRASIVPTGLSSVVSVAAGMSHRLALKSDGTVVAWGDNASGQTNVPAGLANVVAIAAGDYHSLALQADGTIAAWGANGYGESSPPPNLGHVVELAAGTGFSVGLRSDGTVVAWGDTFFGSNVVPAGLNQVAGIAAAHKQTLAVKDDGTVRAWGSNESGQATIPGGLTSVAAVATGSFHSLALQADGTVVVWGSIPPSRATGLAGVVALAAGWDIALALKADGTVASLGSVAPPQNGLSGVIMLAAGGRSVVAVRDSNVRVAPNIVNSPRARTVSLGQSATFSVDVSAGVMSLRYQWFRDGVAIPGATNPTYTIPSVTPADAGAYTVTISNAGSSVTSSSALLTINAPGRLTNLSIRTNAGTGAQTLIVGVTIGGAGTSGRKPLLVRGVGPSLAAFGLSEVLEDPILTLFAGPVQTDANDNWAGSNEVANLAAQVGAFPLMATTSRDSALVSTPLAGGYTIQIAGLGGTTGLALAEIYDATPAASFSTGTPRLTNVSARTRVGTGSDILIAGFTVGGSASQRVLIRAVGPTLAQFGVGGVLTDPKLELFSGVRLLDSNDNWGGGVTIAAAAGSVGAFGFDVASKDSALLVTLPPGGYTAQVSGVGETMGVALIEIYEVP